MDEWHSGRMADVTDDDFDRPRGVQCWREVRRPQRPQRCRRLGRVVSLDGVYIDLPSPQKQRREDPDDGQMDAFELPARNLSADGAEDMWKVRVNRTFLHFHIAEQERELRHVVSAPGRLESFYFDCADSASNSSISEARIISAQSADSTAVSVKSHEAGSDDERDECSSQETEAKVACALDAALDDANCHATRSVEETASPNMDDSDQEDAKIEGRKLSKTAKRNQRKRAQEKNGKSGSPMAQLDAGCSGTAYSAADRAQLKSKFLDVFRAGKLAGSSHGGGSPSKDGGHQRQLGTLTPQELAKFDCNSRRLLVSVHGDIFDVSGAPEKYGPKGVHRMSSGRDITWAILSGSYNPVNLNRFYDIFKVDEQILLDRLLPVLCNALVELERKHGQPVGRLSVFENEEATLPPPPLNQIVDCVLQ